MHSCVKRYLWTLLGDRPAHHECAPSC